MTAPLMTVAIPTRNRFNLLQRATKSVIAQTFKDFELIIIDNASTDATPTILGAVTDKRIVYRRNTTNIGIIGNWNRAVELATGEYLCIFHDDDVMHPLFLERSIEALSRFPAVGFSFPLVRRVDLEGRFLSMWCARSLYPEAGLIPGISYILTSIEQGRCISIAPSMVFRRNVYKIAGKYSQAYGFNTFDMNMWLRIALTYDTYLIDEVLLDYTIHINQMSERHWRTPESPSGPIGTALELFDAAARLMRHPIAEDPATRALIAKAMLSLNERLAQDLTSVIPDL